MTSPTTATPAHPITATLNGLARTEPIILGLTATFILFVVSLIANFQNLELQEIILQLAPLITLLGGGKYARDRVISADTYDGAVLNVKAQTEAQIVEYLEAETAKVTDYWDELEETYNPEQPVTLDDAFTLTIPGDE